MNLKTTKPQLLSILVLTLGLQACGGSSTNDVISTEETPESTMFTLEFANVPADGITSTFDITTTEVPNVLYPKFLTEAYASVVDSLADWFECDGDQNTFH